MSQDRQDTTIEEALRTAISDAFGAVPAVKRQDMLLAEFAQSGDAQELADAFAGRHWSDLSIEELFWHREMLIALSPLAYRAYLPAYLLACLTNDPRRSADIREYVLYGLHPLSDDTFDQETTRKRLSLLDAGQRAAIAGVLGYIEERWDLGEARDILRAWS